MQVQVQVHVMVMVIVMNESWSTSKVNCRTNVVSAEIRRADNLCHTAVRMHTPLISISISISKVLARSIGINASMTSQELSFGVYVIYKSRRIFSKIVSVLANVAPQYPQYNIENIISQLEFT